MDRKTIPEMNEKQLKIFNDQINIKIEVDSYEQITLQVGGNIEYTPLNESRATGYFKGNIFGECFDTDMIDPEEVIKKAAFSFVDNNFDIEKTGKDMSAFKNSIVKSLERFI